MAERPSGDVGASGGKAETVTSVAWSAISKRLDGQDHVHCLDGAGRARPAAGEVDQPVPAVPAMPRKDLRLTVGLYRMQRRFGAGLG